MERKNIRKRPAHERKMPVALSLSTNELDRIDSAARKAGFSSRSAFISRMGDAVDRLLPEPDGDAELPVDTAELAAKISYDKRRYARSRRRSLSASMPEEAFDAIYDLRDDMGVKGLGEVVTALLDFADAHRDDPGMPPGARGFFHSRGITRTPEEENKWARDVREALERRKREREIHAGGPAVPAIDPMKDPADEDPLGINSEPDPLDA